ncbi:UNVERIFIED_ORG: hypothetical protein [Escherichia phage CMSTMSU]
MTEELNIYKTLDFNDLYDLAEVKEKALIHNAARDQIERRVQELALKYDAYDRELATAKLALNVSIDKLKTIDISTELENHNELEIWKQLEGILKENNNQKRFKEQNLTH